jgi:hypothetical protein
VLPGTRETSYCAIDFDSAAHQGLSDTIDFIANSLMPHRPMLNELSAAGGAISLYVSLFPSENSGETIATSIVAKLADLKISIDLDVYPLANHDTQ